MYISNEVGYFRQSRVTLLMLQPKTSRDRSSRGSFFWGNDHREILGTFSFMIAYDGSLGVHPYTSIHLRETNPHTIGQREVNISFKVWLKLSSMGTRYLLS